MERNTFQLQGDVYERVPAGDLEHLVGHLLDELGTWIVILVHTVAKAHQANFLVQYSFDVGRDVLLVTDLAQHPEDGLVGAPVQRAVQRCGRGGHSAIGIDVARPHGPHRAGRAVLPVVTVQDEQDIESFLEYRIGLVLCLRRPVHHVQEVPGVRQIVVRIHVREPDTMTIGEGSDGRRLGDQPLYLVFAAFGVVKLFGVGVEGRQRRHGADENAHRMCIVAEPFHEFLHVLMEKRVSRDLVAPLIEFVSCGKLSDNQQIGHLHEGALLG